MLLTIGFPQTIEQWAEVHATVWSGHPTLPPNWIRCWARSRDREYHVDTTSMRTTFQIEEVM